MENEPRENTVTIPEKERHYELVKHGDLNRCSCGYTTDDVTDIIAHLIDPTKGKYLDSRFTMV